VIYLLYLIAIFVQVRKLFVPGIKKYTAKDEESSNYDL